MDGGVSRRYRLGQRLRTWRPAPPADAAVPTDAAQPGDPEWFGRELAIAAAPPWWFWRLMLRVWAPPVAHLPGRLRVTGQLTPELRRGPVLFAVNHIGDYDTLLIAAALHSIGVVPRFLVTGGILDAPVVGPLLERSGGIRVERGTDVAAHAIRVTRTALAHGGHVVAYPEGRIGLTADGWPERGRTGLARLALEAGVPVVPVSQWGAHEVLQYGNDWGKLRTFLRALVRRPALRVHIGPPVVLDDLRLGRVGDAHRARMRIAAAITRGLVPLRADEPRDRVAFVDRTRPTTATAAFPGGRVPDDVP